MYTHLMKLAVEATGPRTNLCWDPEITAPYNADNHVWPPIAVLPLGIMNTGYMIVMVHLYWWNIQQHREGQ